MKSNKPLIAESKAPHYELHETNNGYTCVGQRDSFHITPEEYDLLNKFYHVTEERRAYARSTYRKKIIEAFGFFNTSELEVRNKLSNGLDKREPSLFHCVFSTYAYKSDGISVPQMIRGFQLLAKKGNVNYITIYGTELHHQHFANFDDHLAKLLLGYLSRQRSFDRTQLSDEPTLDELIPLMTNNVLSGAVGFDTLRVIKELRLVNINPHTIIADYARYNQHNYLIHQLNDEFTGIY